jgi:hypothetical protein
MGVARALLLLEVGPATRGLVEGGPLADHPETE